MKCRAYIKSDLVRYYGRINAICFIKAICFNRSFRWSCAYRLCHSDFAIIKLIGILAHRYFSMKYGLHIPYKTKIGYGLYIGHHMCVVINQTAVIGNNCNLGPFTTIGSNLGKAAEIGDEVYIGPNVCIIENIKIGSQSTIGAGSVVVKDVLAGSTVAGVPARLISNKTPGRYIHNKYVNI